MKRFLPIIFALLASALPAMATHNRAGEITYRQISKNPPTFEFTILTYTKSSSQADRKELELNYGDGKVDTVPRIKIVPLPDDMQRNEYVARHTFNGGGVYIISVTDPNRNASIVNIPNSIDVVFYIETMMTISPFLGYNNSPVLLNPPVDNAALNQIFIHNPNAWDVDGDSLAYHLITCKQEGGLNIPGYTLPSQHPPGPANQVSLDEITGDFVWDSPKLKGEYNVAILIEEWRKGVRIGYVLRDMQIDVYDQNNNAPDIQAIPDYCVMAGDSIRFKVTATDPDIGQHVTLSGTGGPLEVSSDPADFPQPFTGVGTVSSTFTWATNCDHIRKEFYEMVFKAEDDFGKQHLVDMESVLIRIIGPPAQNLTAVPFGNTMVLDWNPPRCGNATGYKIYRRIGCANFVPDTCKPGIDPSSGFVLIGSVDASTFTFTDDNGGLGLSHGKTYSYVVVAMYPNETNGLASSQVCMQLKKDVPIITHVDVRKTDPSNGEVYLQWSMPTELDTIKFPGPYTYRIYGNSGFYENNPALIGIENALTDTFSVHLGVNTVDDANTYRIDLYNGPSGSETYLGSTQAASSIFLTLDGSDNALQL
ncbi:MAG: fibronectin type III domain-containing protein, partial [Flavobacteriales bacterium]|nr:fibronectin type III domain-containing protein [Flavobacteriales bacterium]